MTFVKKIIEQVFPDPDAVTTGRKPLVSGQLSRNDKFLSKYRKWLVEKKHSKLSGMINRSYRHSLISKSSKINIGLYKDTGIEGLFIRDNETMKKDDFRFLLEYLKEKVLKLRYNLYHGITDSREESGYIRTREEYYLKPAVLSTGLPVSQEYGNITLELNTLNDRVQFLKIAATTYSGRNYKEPMPFHDLIEHLFPAG